MRPQELYGQVGMTHGVLDGVADQLRLLVAETETWDPARLTVDDSAVHTPAGAVADVRDELRAAVAALELAVGHVEAAWGSASRIGEA
ncbi:hypothetical protein [Corynebacterium sp. 335C]